MANLTRSAPALSRDEKLKMLVEDLRESIATDDPIKHAHVRSEFYNMQAQEARARGDELTILLLTAIEESNRLHMHGLSGLLHSLLLFHRAGVVDSICGMALNPVAAEFIPGIVRMAKAASVERAASVEKAEREGRQS